MIGEARIRDRLLTNPKAASDMPKFLSNPSRTRRRLHPVIPTPSTGTRTHKKQLILH